MKSLLPILGLLVLTGCSGDTAFPTPTGKGSVSAINALTAAPELRFLNEEQFQATLVDRAGGGNRRWDDFDYTFNFEVAFAGDVAFTRIASQPLKVERDRDYTLVITGTTANPVVTVWEQAERSFADGGTVFEARFAHLAPSAGPVDVYFAAAGTAPAPGEERGTLDFGEVLDATDFEAGNYVLTVTTAGNPADVLFQSSDPEYAAGVASIVALFDGVEDETAPYTGRVIAANGGTGVIADARFGPTVRLLQAAISLPAADVYDDEMLTNLVVDNHVFGDVTGDIDIPEGVTTYRYTPAGNPGAILFESGISTIQGLRYNYVVTGDGAERVATTFLVDRQPVATQVRLRIFHAAENNPDVDVYITPRGGAISAEFLALLGFDFTLRSDPIVLGAGSFDLYVTSTLDTTPIAGPVALDVALGDVVEMVLYDNVDPAIVDARIIPAP